MDATLNPKQADPRHVLIARADEELAHAYEQIRQADEQIARAEEQVSNLERRCRAQGQPAVAWRAGDTRLNGLNVDTNNTFGSTGNRRADRRRSVARLDAVAPVDGTRHRNPGARNRVA